MILAALALIARASTAKSAIEPHQDVNWTVESVDCPKDFSYAKDRSLRVDTAGTTGFGSALQLGDGGYPYISYLAADTGDQYFVKLAYQDATGWHTQTLDDRKGGVGNSIALDSQNRTHIAYSGLTDSHLLIAVPDSNLKFVYMPMVVKGVIFLEKRPMQNYRFFTDNIEKLYFLSSIYSYAIPASPSEEIEKIILLKNEYGIVIVLFDRREYGAEYQAMIAGLQPLYQGVADVYTAP